MNGISIQVASTPSTTPLCTILLPKHLLRSLLKLVDFHNERKPRIYIHIHIYICNSWMTITMVIMTDCSTIFLSCSFHAVYNSYSVYSDIFNEILIPIPANSLVKYRKTYGSFTGCTAVWLWQVLHVCWNCRRVKVERNA